MHPWRGLSLGFLRNARSISIGVAAISQLAIGAVGCGGSGRRNPVDAGLESRLDAQIDRNPDTVGGVAWTFGGTSERVITSPSEAADGTLYFLTLTPGAGQTSQTSYEKIDPVGLRSADGAVQSRVSLAGAGDSGAVGLVTALRGRPVAIGDATGDVWAQTGDSVLRIHAGAVAWTTPVPAAAGPLGWWSSAFGPADLGGALSPAGEYYFTTQTSLVKVAADGTVAWTATRGKGRGADLDPGTVRGGAPALGSDGTVYASCDGCSSTMATVGGLAAFDPGTGSILWVVGADVGHPALGSPTVTGGGAILEAVSFDGSNLDLVGADSTGTAIAFPSLGVPLWNGVVPPIVSGGSVARAASGEARIEVSGGGVTVTSGSAEVVVVELVGDGGALEIVAPSDAGLSPGSLALIDSSGATLSKLAEGSIDTSIYPLPSGTSVFAVTPDGALVAFDAGRLVAPGTDLAPTRAAARQ